MTKTEKGQDLKAPHVAISKLRPIAEISKDAKEGDIVRLIFEGGIHHYVGHFVGECSNGRHLRFCDPYSRHSSNPDDPRKDIKIMGNTSYKELIIDGMIFCAGPNQRVRGYEILKRAEEY